MPRRHPALGLALPPLPDLHSVRRPGGPGRIVHDKTKFNSMLRTMAGPAECVNWVIPGKLLMGAFPAGPAKLSKQNRGEETGLNEMGGVSAALLYVGVRAFVDLVPDDEAEAYQDQLGDQWAKLESMGRALLMQDPRASYDACHMYGDDYDDDDEDHAPLSGCLCGIQPLVWVVLTKLQNSRARSNRSRFGWFLDGSIALVEFSKHNRRDCVETVAYAHIEVGLKI